MKSTFLRAALVTLMVSAVAGCGGGGGGSGTIGGGGGGGTGGTTPPAVTDPTAAISAAAADPTKATSTNPNAAFTILQNAGFPVVTVGSPPKINFTVLDNGAVVKGLTSTNVSVGLVKLVKGTNGSPDQWVSYVYRTETATAGVGPGGTPALATATQPTTDPKSDAQLVYNSAGYYTYTFSTDITDPTKTNGVTYEPSLTHRVAIQLSYTNAAGATVRVNPTFDFTLSSGQSQPVTDSNLTRKVVDVSSCNECHDKLALHGGGRVDTQFCVVCHNSGNTDANSGNVLDLRIMAHKIHAGEHAKEWFGKEYTIWGYRDTAHNYAEVRYPQPLQNCTKCHSASKTGSDGKPLAAQGDNWKNVPSRAACGACHQGIDFATGKGLRIEDAENGLTTSQFGHVGGIQTDDSKCALCHSAAGIETYHVTVDPKGSSGRGAYNGLTIPLASQERLPEGVDKLDFQIKQVTVAGAAGAKKATVVYRILKNGAPATINTTVGGALITGYGGTPDIYVAYAVPQDGIADPADWNASISVHLTEIRDAVSTKGSQTGPDADGYYTATLAATIPDNALMVTAGLGINYNGLVQLGHADYPDGIRVREHAFAVKTADGYTARRGIVDTEKCNKCHSQLGVGPSFHSGARNNATGCAICHDPNRATGHTGSPDYGGGWSVAIKNLVHGIHGASKREQAYSYEASAANPLGFGVVAYPGILKNCETCHVTGSYDFTATANKAAATGGKLLWFTDAKTDMTNPTTTSIGLSPWVTTQGSGQVDYRSDNLVSSPIASSCFGCHDTSLAVQHMEQNGGVIVRRFSTVASTPTRPGVANSSGVVNPAGTTSTMTFTKSETCLLCHGSGKVADIKVMHQR